MAAPSAVDVPAMVIDELARAEFGTAERRAFGNVPVERSEADPEYATAEIVPPPPIFSVLPSVPESVRVLLTVNVFRFTIVSVPVDVVIVKLFTLEGVIAPSVSVIEGVVVAFATEPETPFAVTTETLVTVPVP
jgi:hypothetical protein